MIPLASLENGVLGLRKWGEKYKCFSRKKKVIAILFDQQTSLLISKKKKKRISPSHNKATTSKILKNKIAFLLEQTSMTNHPNFKENKRRKFNQTAFQSCITSLFTFLKNKQMPHYNKKQCASYRTACNHNTFVKQNYFLALHKNISTLSKPF